MQIWFDNAGIIVDSGLYGHKPIFYQLGVVPMGLVNLLKRVSSAKVLGLALILLVTSCGSCKTQENIYVSSNTCGEYKAAKLALDNSCKVLCGNSTGSGSFIYNNIVITAYHVVESKDISNNIDIIDNINIMSFDWKIIYKDIVNDIAILQRDGTTGKGNRKWKGWTKELTLADKIFVAGYPWGEGPILTSGYLSCITRDGGYFWISANALPGSSGSGVYDSSGRFIGVLVRGLVRWGDWSQFTFHAVPISFASDFMSKNKIK